MEETNPRLKAVFMEIVENQIRDGDPPETRQTMERLKSQGISDADARIYIGQAICLELWDTMRNKKEFNMERFVRNLKALPAEPEE